MLGTRCHSKHAPLDDVLGELRHAFLELRCQISSLRSTEVLQQRAGSGREEQRVAVDGREDVGQS